MRILTPDIMGRAANQMFIIFSCYGLVKKYDMELRLPKETLNTDLWPNFHHIFHGHIKFCDGTEEYNHYVIEDNHKSIEDTIKDLPGNIRVHGYFQKYTYFSRYIDDFRRMLGMNKFYDNYLSIHQRFGDYTKLQDYHTNLTVNYYNTAIAEFNERRKFGLRNIYALSFSDDIEIAAEVLQKTNLHIFESFHESIRKDFMTMASCQYMIIANSSFSLMSAILNPHPKKMVICPDESIWFGPVNKKLDTSGMIPLEFIRIKQI